MSLKNIMQSEWRQTQKVTYCTIPFKWNIQDTYIHGDKTQIGGCQRLAGREDRAKLNEYRVYFYSDGNVLKLDRFGGCTTFWL